jgi:hypothetical protein
VSEYIMAASLAGSDRGCESEWAMQIKQMEFASMPSVSTCGSRAESRVGNCGRHAERDKIAITQELVAQLS